MFKLILTLALVSAPAFANDNTEIREAKALAETVERLSQQPAELTSEGCFQTQHVLAQSDQLSKTLLEKSLSWTSLDHSQTYKLTSLTLQLIEATSAETCKKAQAALNQINKISTNLKTELQSLEAQTQQK